MLTGTLNEIDLGGGYEHFAGHGASCLVMEGPVVRSDVRGVVLALVYSHKAQVRVAGRTNVSINGS
jgi:hypothetical protein